MRIGEVIRSKKFELAKLFLSRIYGTLPQSGNWKLFLRRELRRWLPGLDDVDNKNPNSFSRIFFWTFQKAETLKARNFLISRKTLTAPPLLS